MVLIPAKLFLRAEHGQARGKIGPLLELVPDGLGPYTGAGACPKKVLKTQHSGTKLGLARGAVFGPSPRRATSGTKHF